MLYRDYGKTGKKVSLLGFGGMRFAHIDDHDECIRMMVRAAKGGVNYFDTAPGYFETKSESVFGEGLAELRKRALPYYTATKTFKSTEADLRKEIEGQLRRLNIDAVDFYHVWCITSLDNWQARKKNGILTTLEKFRAEGLIRHICVSSHLIQDEIEELLMEGVFEGVLFGYSAYNFRTREKAFNAVRNKKLGAVVMNPLGGGIIPQHPELFAFLKETADETVAAAALRFLWDHRDISVTLVGFASEADVESALAAMQNYSPSTETALVAKKEKASISLEGLCTGCAYCDDCPQSIPIPRYMDAYNQKLLTTEDSALSQRLAMHWGISPRGAAACIACGQCEAACTQHLPIVRRLAEIAGMETR
ncbi:MAG: aldo/keto reductase [Spirochaetaceae bacterium]|jgi:predicted aldo/keto reductase-like oxidoreductase|nr:aldo/keto reductase [Spirochaetaceae bacterium]